MIKPKTIALIGVGGHGGRHLATIDKLEAEGLVRLVCVADPFPEKQAELKAALQGRDVHWYTDYREMIASESGLDLAVISTPIPLHEEMTTDLLRETSARILLEKPAVPTIQQLDRLIAADPLRRVRVGYQTVFRPQVHQLKAWLQSGRLGQLESVAVVAGWPRQNAYYSRASWAGKMAHHGRPVFDGPATNGLSHLLNNIAFLLGRDAATFASPDAVRGALFRARNLESYDTAQIECRMEGVAVHVLLTHAVVETFPFQIIVRGKNGAASFLEKEPLLTNSLGLVWSREGVEIDDKASMYREFCSDDAVFDRMVGTLTDVRPYTLWTNAAFLSSGGIHDIPSSAITRDSDGCVDVRALFLALEPFSREPRPLSELGCAWASLGKWVKTSEVTHLELA